MAKITQLPFDILDEILPYLAVQDFLTFTASCKQFREILNDPLYWKKATISTFRVRNRPSTDSHNDGVLWRKLYRRLRIQTRIFMWGQASRNGDVEQLDIGINGEIKPGIISDLQCGGWCTVFLNHKGELFLQGKIDGEAFNPRGMNQNFGTLKFPDEATGAEITIRQFSAGRKHIMGLADDGTVWLFYGAALPAKKIQFEEAEQLSDPTTPSKNLSVSHVVAGWGTSGMYMRGKGIVFWEYVSPLAMDGRPNENFDNNEFITIPRSGFMTSKGARTMSIYENEPIESPQLEQGKDDAESPGEVVSFTLLEHFVLFCTDKGKLLVHKPGTEVSLEIIGLGFVTDVQGTFRQFVIFQNDGAVITAQQDLLHEIFTNHHTSSQDSLELDDTARYIRRFTRIPALQNSGVIQVVFGDYHLHALHSDGRITSYGKDPQNCGALGLGRPSQPLSARGSILIDPLQQWNSDLQLLPHTSQRGRAIWFHQDQVAWAHFISSAFFNHYENPLLETNKLGELSEWVEQYGTGWDTEEELDVGEHDGLGAYFALTVAAGGWRGGALVLVNEELVEAVKRKNRSRALVVTNDATDSGQSNRIWWWELVFPETISGLPNIKLSDGHLLMDDSAPAAAWKYPPPAWNV